MAKYLLAYHGGNMPDTEEEQQRVMAAWTKWYDKLGGAVVDQGNPVGQTMTIAADGKASKGGGSNPVTGYTIIQAASMDAAVKQSKGCPVLASGGGVEVCETFDVM